MKNKLKQLGSYLWGICSRNVMLKILSFVFAILLWSYVISSDTSITRIKTISNLTGYVSGQASLEIYDLALLTDPTEALKDVTVQLQVPQASYSSARTENVQVMLDVSSVRTAGVQEIPLKATTSYGKVVSIYPSSLSLTFEPLDSRSIPVQAVLYDKDDDHYWYNVLRTNPQSITVSGASSLVQSISYAMCATTLEDRVSSFYTSQAIQLVDNEGNVVPSTMLNRSATTATLNIEIYPSKEMELSTAVEDVLAGQVADGYIIESVTLSPKNVTVAADAELLDNLDKLVITPIEIDSPNQSFTRRAQISGLSDFKYISSAEVYVSVQIVEETVSTWLNDVTVSVIGCGEGLTPSWQRGTISVHVTGPRSKVEAVAQSGLNAVVDLTGLEEGIHLVSIQLESDNYPSLTLEPDITELQVLLEKSAE